MKISKFANVISGANWIINLANAGGENFFPVTKISFCFSHQGCKSNKRNQSFQEFSNWQPIGNIFWSPLLIKQSLPFPETFFICNHLNSRFIPDFGSLVRGGAGKAWSRREGGQGWAASPPSPLKSPRPTKLYITRRASYSYRLGTLSDL